MFRSLFRFIGGLFRYLLLWMDVVRRVVINLVFLLLIGIVVALFWRPEPSFSDGAVLVVRPAGVLVEQSRSDEPFDLLRVGSPLSTQTALHELLEAIDAARDDDRIAALVIETDDLSQGGVSKLSELRVAIERFKRSGKPVLARGERFSQGQYYLASVADEVHVSPDGFVLLRGLARYTSYFGNALESLGVKVHVFRVGEYKSFSEPFTRSDMSVQDRESTRDLLEGIWSAFRDDIAASRNLQVDALDHYIMDFGAALSSSGGDGAQAAFEAGLVDHLSTRNQWRALLSERFGTNDDGSDYRGVSVGRYLQSVRPPSVPDARIAVLAAQGPIVDGSGAPGSIGGDAMARRIRELREDDSVKAVILRIDSPGGSAWASELIRRELEETRRAGKPVIASMSSTAASGGYWIAAGADEIWAHPLTLTGSIGIFAIFPEFTEPLERMGITHDGVATAPLAGAFDPRRPLEPLAAEALQIGIQYGYRRFLETVALARNMSIEQVELAARGRVWTGEAASKIGLIDELGGIEAAIGAAARRAGLERYEVVWAEDRRSPAGLLMQRLRDFTGVQVPHADTRVSSPMGKLLASVEREATALLSWNDPQHLYVHCLCEGP